jgi:large subunit ribosomal protein L30
MNSTGDGNKQLKIKLVKSGIGCPERQRKVVRGLGFHSLNQVVVHPDTPEIRGMIFKIRHLVEVIET